MLDGPINSESFTAYVTQFLLPTLSPGDVVITDNVGNRKGAAVGKVIQEAGARLLFLPSLLPSIKPDRAGLRQTQTPVA